MGDGIGDAGHLPEGTEVVLMVHHGGPDCRVITESGLYVQLAFAALRPGP